MNTVKFYKDKIVIFVYDEKNDEWVEKDIRELHNPFTFYFSKFVEFDDNLTVFDFIKHLNLNKEIIDNFFLGYNNGVSIEKFYEECLEKIEEGYSDKINQIQIIWETNTYKDETINVRFVNSWTTFFGNFNEKRETETNADIPIKSVNLIRLRNWKHIPLRLNRFIYFQEFDVNKKIKVHAKLNGIREFTLLDIICGFLKELTWYGDPKQQVKAAKKITQNFREMKEIKKDEVIIDIKKPVSKYDLKHLEYELKKCIYEEDYLKAKSIKEQIDIEKKNQEQ